MNDILVNISFYNKDLTLKDVPLTVFKDLSNFESYFEEKQQEMIETTDGAYVPISDYDYEDFTVDSVGGLGGFADELADITILELSNYAELLATLQEENESVFDNLEEISKNFGYPLEDLLKVNPSDMTFYETWNDYCDSLGEIYELNKPFLWSTIDTFIDWEQVKRDLQINASMSYYEDSVLDIAE